MTSLNILLEVSHNRRLEEVSFAAMAGEVEEMDSGLLPDMETFNPDSGFVCVPIPQVQDDPEAHPEDDQFDPMASFTVDEAPEASTYLVRGTVEEDKLADFENEVARKRSVVGCYSDVSISNFLVCPSSPPVGDDKDVEGLLYVPSFRKCKMDGTGVLVAVVDTGIDLRYLNAHGKTPNTDPARSWSWDPSVVTPFNAPLNHGTMVAYDVCIAAPRCTLLDIALLHPISAPPGGSLMSGLLSDAIRAYRHLLNVMNAPRRPGENRSLVVNNSWGMFNPSWDFPVGHPGNYSDNPNHPFNRIVAALERAGADIIFAAGNCGAPCPDSRCGGVTVRTIYGANSSPHVTTVAGVDIKKQRVGYSSTGPGRLERRKPDISGYTHFKGSGVYSADGGTSAASPVVAGVVAAIRTKRPFDPAVASTRPSAIRSLITSTATDLGPSGFDFLHGYGVVNGYRIYRKLCLTLPPICRRYPWICRSQICERYPWICDPDWHRKVRVSEPVPPRLAPFGLAQADQEAAAGYGLAYGDMDEDMMALDDELTLEEMAYIAMMLQGEAESSAQESSEVSDDCGCKE